MMRYKNMIESLAVIGVFGITITSIAALYYKMGHLETKVSFIYDNIKTIISFKDNNK